MRKRATEPSWPSPSRPSWRPPAAWREMALVALLLAGCFAVWLPNVDDPATYDEGVYLLSLAALQEGEQLAEEVFASQPPGHYLLLGGLAAVFGEGVQDLRYAYLLVALAGCAAAYAVGRSLAGPLAGGAAALLLAIAPPYAGAAGEIAADLPSSALALAALALALYARRPASWVGVGALVAAALLVKLLAVTAVAAVMLLALRRSARSAALVAGGAAAVLGALRSATAAG